MKRRKSKPQRDTLHDDHHIRPKSRGGGRRNNITVLPREWHATWHKLFVNLTVEEVHQFIDEVMVPNTQWTHRDLHNLRDRIMRQRLAS